MRARRSRRRLDKKALASRKADVEETLFVSGDRWALMALIGIPLLQLKFKTAQFVIKCKDSTNPQEHVLTVLTVLRYRHHCLAR